MDSFTTSQRRTIYITLIVLVFLNIFALAHAFANNKEVTNSVEDTTQTTNQNSQELFIELLTPETNQFETSSESITVQFRTNGDEVLVNNEEFTSSRNNVYTTIIDLEPGSQLVTIQSKLDGNTEVLDILVNRVSN